MINKDILKPIIFAGLFAVPFVPFLVSSSLFFPFITTKAFAWRIIIEIVFAAWLLLAAVEPAYRPKKSPILYAVLGFIILIGISDLLGVSPERSFWSNFERMEGFLSLLHLGAFFIVIGSVFKEADWKKWWNTNLVASVLMSFHVLFQVFGVLKLSQGGMRAEGTLGNPIYLAVYVLFHIFIALFFLVREWKRSNGLRYFYIGLIILETYILYQTATRGAILGFVGGVFILALLNWRKKIAMGAIIGVLALVAGFFLVKDSSFVNDSPVLSRFGSLSFEEIKTQGRYFVWPLALEGFKENPILGWGQENFQQVFQKYYQPEMYNLEPWFDRAHNIFLDWLVVGGIVGLLAYLSLYVALIYLLYKDKSLLYLEKTIIFALVLAYFFHNFFVFDHLISYILFFSLLAFIHSRAEASPVWDSAISYRAGFILYALVPVALISSLYLINSKPIKANVSIVEAFHALGNGETVLAGNEFRQAYQSGSLGRQEVLEQMVVRSMQILSAPTAIEARNEFYRFAKDASIETADNFPNDARTQLVTGAFLVSTGSLEQGIERLEAAKSLAPNKQQMYLELANAYVLNGDKDKAIAILNELGIISPAHKVQIEEYIKQVRSL